MKKSLKGICAVSIVLTILVSTLSACGKKIEKINTNNGSTNVNIIQNGTTADQGDYVPADSNDTQNDNNSQGGFFENLFGGGNSQGSSSDSNYVNPVDNTPSDSTDGYSDISTDSFGGDETTTSRTKFKDRFTTTTTTSTSKTTRPPTSNPVDQVKVLNSASLYPMLTNDSELDALVENVLAQTTNSSMSTYDKVRSVYNYLVQTNRYGTAMKINLNSRYYSAYDSDVVGRAKAILKYHTGNCVDFSAAFMAITRRIGLDCYLVTGQILNKYGESSFHGWNIIRINGKDYGFDCEGDFRSSGSGKKETTYWLFCVDDPVKFEAKYTRIAVASFKNFKIY